MKQISLGLNLSTKKTRKREFLNYMERVVPWKALVQIIEPHWPKSKTGRPPFAIETMLHIHYLQHWFGLSDPASVDISSGPVHSVVGTSANVADINVAGRLLHGSEDVAFGDSGYRGIHKRSEARGPKWFVAM